MIEKEEIIYRYTIKEAEEDGVLFQIFQVNPDWEKGIFSHITTNLLSQGYEVEGIINIPNLLDLLNQCANLVHQLSKSYSEYNSFFKGMIELPNGSVKEIFMCENEIGKFTAMLPEDYQLKSISKKKIMESLK
jgi:hypothetical protein